MRDRDGHVYRETKSFTIASKTPVLRARLEKPRVHAGETIHISAQASGNARTITARLYGALPVALRWNSAAKANTGEIVVALVDDSEATLKRLRRRGDSIALEAANPAYETRLYGADRVKVQGKLVGLIRRY